MHMHARMFGLCVAVVLAFAARSAARDVWESEDGSRSLSLDTSIKGTAISTVTPDIPSIYTEDDIFTSLWRLRFTLKFHAGDASRYELAYENRVRLASPDSNLIAGGGLLPANLDAPYRIDQLDEVVASSDDEAYTHRHEIDRLYAAYDISFGERQGQFTIGRQSIGMGRGVFFGAIDMFAPFSPTEVDREWRRGVDAAKLDVPLADTVSCDLTAVLGETSDDSALLGRVRGYSMDSGNDLGVVFGKRGEDSLIGLTTSFTVGEASMYIDVATFDIPEHGGDGQFFGMDGVTSKAVIGVSHKLGGGDGPTLMAEYHYSGFGVEDVSDLPMLPTDPFYQRLLRGDMQILTQQAVAMQLTWELSDVWSGGFTVIANPLDGSGVLQPALTWNFADNVTIAISGSVTWGDEPLGPLPLPESEYGSGLSSLYLQISIYD
jgi:hypothetical protein